MQLSCPLTASAQGEWRKCTKLGGRVKEKTVRTHLLPQNLAFKWDKLGKLQNDFSEKILACNIIFSAHGHIVSILLPSHRFIVSNSGKQIRQGFCRKYITSCTMVSFPGPFGGIRPFETSLERGRMQFVIAKPRMRNHSVNTLHMHKTWRRLHKYKYTRRQAEAYKHKYTQAQVYQATS